MYLAVNGWKTIPVGSQCTTNLAQRRRLSDRLLGQESRWAAEAAECANEQGRFWDYYEKLFTEQGGENVGIFSKQNLQRFAGELGLNMASFSACLTSGKHTERVLLDINEAASKGVRGTPTLFVNGRRVEGGSDYTVLRQAIEVALNAK